MWDVAAFFNLYLFDESSGLSGFDDSDVFIQPEMLEFVLNIMLVYWT